jgi:hypothetical protein
LAEHALRIEVIADARQAGSLDDATRVEIETEVAAIEAELKKFR